MGQPDPGTVSLGVHQLPTGQLGQPPSPGQVCIQQHLALCNHGHPFLANKGFHPNLKCPSNLLCQTLLTKLLQISKNCICTSMTRSLMPSINTKSTQPPNASQFLLFKSEIPSGWTHGTSRQCAPQRSLIITSWDPF